MIRRWLRRIFAHQCDPPWNRPLTADDSIWKCPECGDIWRWALLEDLGWRASPVGWKRDNW